MGKKYHSAYLLVGLLFVFLLSGCATTIPNAKFAQKIEPENQIIAADDATVKLSANDSVVMMESEKSRLAST